VRTRLVSTAVMKLVAHSKRDATLGALREASRAA